MTTVSENWDTTKIIATTNGLNTTTFFYLGLRSVFTLLTISQFSSSLPTALAVSDFFCAPYYSSSSPTTIRRPPHQYPASSAILPQFFSYPSSPLRSNRKRRIDWQHALLISSDLIIDEADVDKVVYHLFGQGASSALEKTCLLRQHRLRRPCLLSSGG